MEAPDARTTTSARVAHVRRIFETPPNFTRRYAGAAPLAPWISCRESCVYPKKQRRHAAGSGRRTQRRPSSAFGRPFEARPAHAHDKKTAISASEALFSLLKSGRTCAEVSAAARDAGAPDALARALVAHESDPLAVHRFCAASTPALELDAGGWAPHLAPAAGAVARALGAFAAEAGVVTAAMLWLERMMAHAPARESAAAAGLEANAVALMRTHVADALLSRYYSEARAV